MKLFHVDAFTSEPFKGNPAAVCMANRLLSDALMQKIAAEMNLSETAFLTEQGDNAYGLRWFTPAIEVDLCGHATLASAHVLYEQGAVSADSTISFHTRSGELSVEKIGDRLTLDFPARRSPSSRPSSPDTDSAAENMVDYLAKLPHGFNEGSAAMAKRIQEDVFKKQARVLKALANESRLKIVDRLSRGECSAGELTDIVGTDRTTVSKHLAVLRAHGIVEDRREGNVVFYRLLTPCVTNFFSCATQVIKERM